MNHVVKLKVAVARSRKCAAAMVAIARFLTSATAIPSLFICFPFNFIFISSSAFVRKRAATK